MKKSKGYWLVDLEKNTGKCKYNYKIVTCSHEEVRNDSETCSQRFSYSNLHCSLCCNISDRILYLLTEDVPDGARLFIYHGTSDVTTHISDGSIQWNYLLGEINKNIHFVLSTNF